LDILITGNVSTFASSLTKYLLTEDHSVVVTGATQDFLSFKAKKFAAFKSNPSDSQYEEIFKSHSYDAVIFIAAQEDYLLDSARPNLGHTNFGLETNLEFSRQNKIGQFIYISSFEVYGNAASTLETITPVPSTEIGQLLLNGENLCRFYVEKHSLTVSILHIPFIYGPNENNSFFYQLVQKASSQKMIKVSTNAQAHCSFLHIDDLANFLKKLFQQENPPKLQIFNLFQNGINFSFLAQQLNFYFPKVKIEFIDKREHPSNLKAEGKIAFEKLNWVPKKDLIKAFPELIEEFSKNSIRKRPLIEKLKQLTVSYKPYFVWGEVIIGAFVMHLLTIWSNTIIEFKNIDYRLLYIVIIGSTHGLVFGVLASVLAAVSTALNWQRVGLDWALLIYNVENWVPFALFFLAGAVTGYIYDKKENEITFEQHQTELIHEKYEFLYKLYDEISSIKDRLREQLVGYRDSFGRFFRIANELNELDEDNVFLKALDVLEDIMENDRIAIYSVQSNGYYGRLAVKSSNLGEETPKSLKLSDYSVAMDALQDGSVFQNKDLLPNYPSYIAPISYQDGLIGLVVIWNADFEQFTLYYLNLFKIVTGLIQSSLVRAATFKNAQIEKLYIPSTEIMFPEAFKQSLNTKKKMRRGKIIDFQIVKIEKEAISWIEFFEKLSKGIRDDDITGLMNENDDFCYVLLANASSDNMEFILERLQKLGLKAVHIEELESD
jgi:nucleoside-diphosphate-sugar epimerase